MFMRRTGACGTRGGAARCRGGHPLLHLRQELEIRHQNVRPAVLPATDDKPQRFHPSRSEAQMKKSAKWKALIRKIKPSKTKERVSQRRTWTKYHCQVFGVDSPVLPLIPNSLDLISKKMKELDYKSIGNYVVAMRRAHIEAGYQWDEQLKLAAGDAAAKGRFRRGPPKRAKCFRLPFVIRTFQLGMFPRTPMRLPQHQVCLGVPT